VDFCGDCGGDCYCCDLCGCVLDYFGAFSSSGGFVGVGLNLENIQIPDKMLQIVANKLQLSNGVRDELAFKLTELKKAFLGSDATVYCEDCGIVFFYGKVERVACEKRFVDWKMLSFRHV
jgi:hypothetical protein